jgi:hypothetical protein
MGEQVVVAVKGWGSAVGTAVTAQTELSVGSNSLATTKVVAVALLASQLAFSQVAMLCGDGGCTCHIGCAARVVHFVSLQKLRQAAVVRLHCHQTGVVQLGWHLAPLHHSHWL